MDKRQQKIQVIREFEQTIRSREKPEMRITKKRRRRLLAGAVLADLMDPLIGILPVIGDLGAPVVTYNLFKRWFDRYNVDGQEFLENGGGGSFGFFTQQIVDFFIGLVPVVGDLADLIFAAWTYKIYQTIEDIREKDQEDIESYKQWRRRQRQMLERKLALIEAGQLPETEQAKAKSAAFGR